MQTEDRLWQTDNNLSLTYHNPAQADDIWLEAENHEFWSDNHSARTEENLSQLEDGLS